MHHANASIAARNVTSPRIDGRTRRAPAKELQRKGCRPTKGKSGKDGKQGDRQERCKGCGAHCGKQGHRDSECWGKRGGWSIEHESQSEPELGGSDIGALEAVGRCAHVRKCGAVKRGERELQTVDKNKVGLATIDSISAASRQTMHAMSTMSPPTKPPEMALHTVQQDVSALQTSGLEPL